ncbi:MAG TPA: BON domain-containing protein [Pyrinomonadaceae bacterium]|nr:BON domain-containing protein [Pyrinomonadaceae bacterium]
MKFKILAGSALSAVLLIGACGGNKDNNANANANRSTPVPTPTAISQTNESAATDPAMKSKVEAALKAKGFNDVTVDTSTPKAVLRGTVPKGKMTEAVRIAQETTGKPVDNQLTEK